MNVRYGVLALGTMVLAAMSGTAALAGEEKTARKIAASETEYLRLEPILVTVKVEESALAGLPAPPGGESAADLFRFEIEPTVKPRPHALPLYSEVQNASARTRKFDLLEWYQFPDNGTFSVRAVYDHAGTRFASEPIRLTIRKPAKGDAEFEAVGRLHHMPWSNYETNAFCGDTFDVVKRWPESKLTKYCHYWSGRNSQNKKEYDKAIASYEALLAQYPGFALADDARLGIEECKKAQSAK